MNIEICTPNSATTKEKGDLLEKLCKKMLEAQNYLVTEEVRNEPYRVCRRVNILRDYPDDKIKIYP